MTITEFKELTGIKKMKLDDVVLFNRGLYRYERIPYTKDTQVRKLNKEKLTGEQIHQEIINNTITIQIYRGEF